MTIKTNHIEIEHYYDSQQLEGEELTQSFAHYVAIQYLIAVLEWFFYGKNVGVVSNVNFYQIEHLKDPPKSPDIAVVEGLVPEERTNEDNPSYWIGDDGPPPLVVFEVASKETWLNDLETKPKSYAGIGIPEYFSFDPNEPSVWTGTWREQLRLVGWRLDTLSGEYRRVEKDGAGRLWSEQLQSWLTIEDKHLRLYTREGELRLTGFEAQTQRAALERARAEAQARRAEAQTQEAALERARAEAQAQRAEAQAQEAALERARVEKLLELLRQKGINPDDLI
ncbi:MAG: Uma2 family endonuclease [Chloroflexota bacterium]|nr:Uma2 family endonuclease [Chloroflexota bacterium]